MKKHDLPYMQFYFGDWKKCPEVQALPLDVRMMWFEMLGIMWESTERGYLTLNGVPITEEFLARIIGTSEEALRVGLTLMDKLRVYSKRETDGAIYCRRIVKDEQARLQCKKYGKLGGNPLLIDGKRVKGMVKGRLKAPLIYDNDNDNDNEDASGNSLHSLIVNRFYAFYEDVFKTKYTTNTREFRTLKEFLTLNPNMTIDRFKAAVENCFDNEFHKKHLSIHYICNNFSTLERLADDK